MKQYVRNHFGYKLTDQEFEDIPNPSVELGVHITRKTFQASCVLLVVTAGVSALRRSPNMTLLQQFTRRISDSGLKWGIIGTAVGPAITVAFIHGKKLEDEAIRDRAFRIRHNRCQVRVDRAEDLGFVGGSLLTLALGQGWVLGAITGVTAGVLGTAVMNAKVWGEQDKK